MKPYIAAAYNMDIEILDTYKEYGVEEIWASVNFPANTFGSGRIFFNEDDETEYEELGRHFKKAKELGIKTSFLFNPPCTGNKEFVEEGMDEIVRMAKFVNRYEVDFITLCQPFLSTVFRKLCPDVRLKLSSHYNCNNIGKFEFGLDTMGFDIVIVSQFANKNFTLLKEVAGRWDPDRLEVMCTFPCVANCPYRLWHSQFVAHGNVLPDGEHVPREIYPCTFDIIHNPGTAMASMFIRREDMKYYRDLGIRRFKIGERKDSTKNNIDTVKYYTGKTGPEFVPPSLFRRFLGSIYEGIDLTAMDGFYEKFVNEECDGMKFNCDDCPHCIEYAKKVFKYKKDLNIKVIPENKEFFNELFLKKYIKKLEESM